MSATPAGDELDALNRELAAQLEADMQQLANELAAPLDAALQQLAEELQAQGFPGDEGAV